MNNQYKWSSITTDDLEAWSALINHLAEVDGTEEFYSAEDLAEALASASLEPTRDTWAVWGDDRMIGFGQLGTAANPDNDGLIRASLDGGVHADYRGLGIGRQLMELLESRAREAVAERHPGKGFFFAADGGREGSSASAMLSRRGFEAARYFTHMERSLDDDQDANQLATRAAPDGVVFRSLEAADEAAVLAAHSAAFRDHWGSSPPSKEQWHEWCTGNRARPADSVIAVDETGEVLAYSLCNEWEDGELYFELIGTVPHARGRGLGTAVLTRALAHALGRYHRAELMVDAESPTGATRLYERIGFTAKFTTVAMRNYHV